jgi:hypothetical protein
MTMPAKAPRWFQLGARVRGMALSLAVVLVAAAIVAGELLDLGARPILTLTGLAVGCWVVGVALTLVPFAPSIEPRSVVSPVTGRWSAVNSPATKVPSHGTHGHGQTFAIDLVYEPEPGARPEFGRDHGPGSVPRPTTPRSASRCNRR